MTLQYNVSQLLKSEVGANRVYDFHDDQSLDLDGGIATQIKGRVKFTLTNFGVMATVQAHACLHLTCARCVEPFSGPVDIAFDEEFQPSIDIVSGLALSAPTNDAAFVIPDSHTIDMTEPLRQNLLLAVEIVPLCRTTCKGLCASCGANLNLLFCNCPPQEEPSPFAALQVLFGGTHSPE